MRTRLLIGVLATAAALIVGLAAPALAADPDSTVLSGPTGVVATGDATFTFSGDDGAGSPATSFECMLDYSAWAACTSPQSYLSLPDAAHTFYVRALGPSGADPTPASQSWTVDVAGPNTSIDSGPTGFVSDTDATFTFSGTDAMSAVGVWGGAGTGDGQFAQPYSIALTGSGEVLVADSANNRVQRFDADGNYLSQFGSLGSGPGQFNAPYGVAVDAAGDIYVTDGANHRVQHFDPSGNYLSEWGTSGTGNGQFNSPRGIAIGSGGNIFVADVYNHRIQKFDATGSFLAKWGSNGITDGQFKYPFGVAAGSGGSVYVADYSNHRIQRFDAGGNFLGKWGTYGAGNGQLKYPYGVSTDAVGNVYVADTYNYRMQVFDPAGAYISQFGARGAANGRFSLPYNSVIAASGDIYVVDLGANRVERFSSAVGAFECQLDGGGWSACTSPVNYTGLAEGAHTFETRAIDQVGSPDPTPASRSWTVDTTGPTATIDTFPTNPTASTDADFTFSATDGAGSGVASLECQLDSGGWSVCTSPQSYTSLAAGSHTFEVKGTDNLGNPGPTASYSWVISGAVDTTPPAAAPTQAPAANGAGWNSSDVTVLWNWTDTESGIDVGNCTTSSVSAGEGNPITLNATCKDLAGNTGSANYDVKVDKTAPTASILSTPSDPTASTSAAFTFSAADLGGSGVASTECKLDAAVWAPCSTPSNYTGLSGGSHTFNVRAKDAADNTGIAASFTWTIDTTGPTATITGSPADPTSATGATFTFTVVDPAGVSSIQCSLDGAAYAACSSPASYAGLANGNHTFAVRGTDTLGNVGVAANFAWLIDLVAPSVTINTGPAQPWSNSATPTFTFTGTDPAPASGVASYECQMDAGAWTPCTSPEAYAALVDGARTFSVRAVDAVGNTGIAATWSWSQDTVAPSIASLTFKRTGGGKRPPSRTFTYTFAGTDPAPASGVASYQCQLDAGGWVACTSPQAYIVATGSTHTFSVRAIDVAGNTGAASSRTDTA